MKRFPYPEKIEDAVEFVYRFRQWLGEGYDVVIWWKTKEEKCHYFDTATGETGEQNPSPKIIADQNISSKKFDKFIQNLVAQNILEFNTVYSPIMKNYNDFYCISLKSGKINYFQDSYKNPVFEKIFDVFEEMRDYPYF